MRIQINTDDNIEGIDSLTSRFEAEIAGGLSRFSDQITAVEVHLSDENAGKGGSDDKRCLLEARPTGSAPVAVRHQAATPDEALSGAVQKMQRKLQSELGRRNHAKGGPSIRDMDPL
ncbi:HPF/RaiA family ribosome-associated protein [Cereibacter sediminicola]|uniref:HPF/RaiA family ribosome-associated protein n=1 Tax=Cereibacter sediminicola TaxID=2584941 RepID=UPI00119D0CF1|nr:HPF/RaiA family ribosome-associated protein [Cereibacter sediminicola]